MNGYNYPDNLLASFFLLEEELVIKKVLYKFSSLLDRKFSRSTGRSIDSTVLLCFNWQQTRKQEGWKQMIIDLTTVVFADRTRSKFTIDCCWPLFNFNFNSSKCCCKEHVNK